MVSLNTASNFYALTQNFGDPENDYIEQYKAGNLTLAAKNVYEAILTNGALNTIDLKTKAHLSAKSADGEFNKAIESLQVDMKILPIGISDAGAWKYSYIYDPVPNHLPNVVENARHLSEKQARVNILTLFFNSVGGEEAKTIQKFFNWKNQDLDKTLDILKERDVIVESKDGDEGKTYFHLKSLI